MLKIKKDDGFKVALSEVIFLRSI